MTMSGSNTAPSLRERALQAARDREGTIGAQRDEERMRARQRRVDDLRKSMRSVLHVDLNESTIRWWDDPWEKREGDKPFAFHEGLYFGFSASWQSQTEPGFHAYMMCEKTTCFGILEVQCVRDLADLGALFDRIASGEALAKHNKQCGVDFS